MKAKARAQKVTHDKLTIAFLGRLQATVASPEYLYQALQAALAENPAMKDKIFFDIYGPVDVAFQKMPAKMGLAEYFKFHGPQPLLPAMTANLEADMVLQYYRDASIISAKTYNYLAMGKPLLALVPPGEVVDIIKKYQPSAVLANVFNKIEMKKALLKSFQLWQNQELSDYNPSPEIEQFSRPRLAKKMAQTFNSLT